MITNLLVLLLLSNNPAWTENACKIIIEQPDGKETLFVHASGTLINGYILTNYHNVNDLKQNGKIKVQFGNYSTEAKLVRWNEYDDLVLLSCKPPDNLKGLKVANREPKEHEVAKMYGFFNLDKTGTLETGTVEDYKSIKLGSTNNIALVRRIEINADHGCSGAALVNSNNEIIGTLIGSFNNNTGCRMTTVTQINRILQECTH